jgi:hypothetical protein
LRRFVALRLLPGETQAPLVKPHEDCNRGRRMAPAAFAVAESDPLGLSVGFEPDCPAQAMTAVDIVLAHGTARTTGQ